MKPSAFCSRGSDQQSTAPRHFGGDFRDSTFVFGADPALQTLSLRDYNALLYSLLKITEAVRHLPDELKDTRPDFPWRDIARTGNLLRHNYFRIDRGIIADIVSNDLPALEQAVEGFWHDLGYGNLPKFN
jgi:uncharacterized protein with HEPN domain